MSESADSLVGNFCSRNVGKNLWYSSFVAEMTFLRRTLYLAPVVGFSFSVVLAIAEDRHGDIRLTLQRPGLLVGGYISTVYGGQVGDIVMVIVNGLSIADFF
jgi:hypothetical protein